MTAVKTEFPRGNAARQAKIFELMAQGTLRVKPDGTVVWKGKEVATKSVGKGYLRIKFYLGNYIDFSELHHRFVYMALIGPIPEGMTVDHIDHNRHNNHPSNLRLLTREDNGRMPGEANGSAKLTEMEVTEIRSIHATGRFTQQEIAERYNVNQTTIGRIVNSKNWH